jgi:hypothetical protein
MQLTQISLALSSVLNAKIRPSLDLDFTQGSLNPRITFTRASSATQYNSVGTLISVGSDVARLDYDPATLAPKGLLIEEQRTNLLIYSSEFDNAAWVKTRATITANATTAPDGTTTADKLIDDGATVGQGYTRQNVTYTNIPYSFSFYAKAGEVTSVTCHIVDSNGVVSASNAIVDLISGTVTSGSANVVSIGNGWWRISVIGTPTASSGSVRILLPTDTATTDGIYIWGAQLEAGAFSTSYIPTTSATVTRAADNASMVGSNFSSWYNQSGGTLVVNGDTVSNSGNRVYFDVGANGAFGTTAYTVQTSTYVGLLPGAAPVNMTSTVTTTALTNKIATAMQNNNSIIAVNASLGVVDAACTMPASATTLTVGGTQFGGTFGNYLNGHIQSIKYYPTRLPNADLQRLTR